MYIFLWIPYTCILRSPLQEFKKLYLQCESVYENPIIIKGERFGKCKYMLTAVCFLNSVIIFKISYIFHVTHFSSAQLLAIFFLLSKMIICFFIVVDKTSFHCFSSQAVQILPTVLASSTSHYWCIISCMPYSFINCFWSNVNRLENWDIYEV